jgi:DNA-binding GntR family transcriptional regulator
VIYHLHINNTNERETVVSTSGGARPSSASSLATKAYNILEKKLVNLTLPPGSLISEGDLIEMTGIGRTPVREAIQQLASQELFEVIPRRGLMVTPVSRSGMLHLLEVRKPLESLIAKQAALKASDTQRSALSQVARDLATAHDNFGRFMQLDYKLGTLLNDCCANPFAVKATAPLRSHSRRFWFYYQEQVQLSDAIAGHSKLARLMARRDFDGAVKASDAVVALLERLVSRLDRLT